jgi:hypothetical protein
MIAMSCRALYMATQPAIQRAIVRHRRKHARGARLYSNQSLTVGTRTADQTMRSAIDRRTLQGFRREASLKKKIRTR